MFLEDHGYAIEAAGTRADGAKLLRTSKPAICLLDMNLPDGSGADLLRMIVAENLPIRVIVMTAFPIDHLRSRYPSSVLVALLTKPVSPQDLLDEVNKISVIGT